MASGITVEVDTRVLERKLKGMEQQIPFALALSLTKMAQGARKDVTDALPRIFDRPNPFTMRAIAFKSASKSDLEALVYIRVAQALYLKLQIDGGTRVPRRRALVLPFDPSTFSAFGGLKRGLVRRLLGQAYVPSAGKATRVVKRGGAFVPAKSQGSARGGGVFSGVPRGHPQARAGIYQRKGGKLRLMVPYEPTAHYRARFPFYQLTVNSIRSSNKRLLNEGVERALRSANNSTGSS